MIVKTGKGYKVVSEDGSKNLSRDGLSYSQAQHRLRQVEWFKHHGHGGRTPHRLRRRD